MYLSTYKEKKYMSEENNNAKLVVEQLKKLNSNFNTFNKIMSNFLVIATTESTFKGKTKEDIKTIVPVVNSTMKTINECIYGK
tara:strand:- start:343 stop:591 length:249 start_codon:yes stop_codon:yes gene_type:complete